MIAGSSARWRRLLHQYHITTYLVYCQVLFSIFIIYLDKCSFLCYYLPVRNLLILFALLILYTPSKGQVTTSYNKLTDTTTVRANLGRPVYDLQLDLYYSHEGKAPVPMVSNFRESSKVTIVFTYSYGSGFDALQILAAGGYSYPKFKEPLRLALPVKHFEELIYLSLPFDFVRYLATANHATLRLVGSELLEIRLSAEQLKILKDFSLYGLNTDIACYQSQPNY